MKQPQNTDSDSTRAGAPNRGVHSGEVLHREMGSVIPNYSRPRIPAENAPIGKRGGHKTVNA